MKYLAYENIKRLHLEITSRCNAACPQCARTAAINDYNNLPLSDLTFDNIKNWFPANLNCHLEEVYCCGNYGDPIIHRELIDIANYFISTGIDTFSIHTNGSARTPEWWKEFGSVLKGHGWVFFSIDGLADTNHIYRVNTNWDKIIENVKAFISTGAQARWNFLVFEHNEHQIEEAKKLAKDLGFKEFNVKISNRFKKINEYNAQKPKQLNHQLTENIEKLVKLKYNNNINEYYKDIKYIDCLTQKRKEIYVDFQGNVFPCCWLATRKFLPEGDESQSLMNTLSKYDDNFNNLNYHTLKEILDHEWFKNELAESWNNSEKRLITCSRMCEKDKNLSTSQYVKRENLNDK